jgi:hypothetical protein
LGVLALALVGCGSARGDDPSRASARASFSAWDRQWRGARRCLLDGDDTLDDATIRIEVAELREETRSPMESVPDPGCLGAVYRLSYPPPVTASAEIEGAWARLEAATSWLMSASSGEEHNEFDMTVQVRWQDRDPDVVGRAIRDVDAARAKLRATLGLPDDQVATSTVPPIDVGPAFGHAPDAQDYLPVEVGIDAIAFRVEDHRYFARDLDRVITLDGPWTRALPDGDWAIGAGPRGVQAANVGRSAAFPPDAILAVAGAWDVLAAFGRGPHRAIVLQRKGATAIVRSTDGGKTWSPPQSLPSLREATAHENWIAGTIDLVAGVREGRPTWTRIDATSGTMSTSSVPEFHSFDAVGVPRPCASGNTLWYIDADGRGFRAAAGSGKPETFEGWGNHLGFLACTDDRALVDTPDDVDVVQASTEQIAFGRVPRGFGVLTASGAAWVAQRRDVIGVWKAGAPRWEPGAPTFARLPHGAQVRAAFEWRARIHLLLQDGDRFRVGRLHSM